jgi:hypothetical protein
MDIPGCSSDPSYNASGLEESADSMDDSVLDALMVDIERFGCVADIDAFKNSRIPEKTMKKVKWGLQIYLSWLNVWRVRYTDGINKVLKDFSDMSLSEMDYTFQYFFAEIRKKNGVQYPPRTLKEIAACLQHHLNYSMKIAVSIFKDPKFCGTREALDAAMKKSAKSGTVKERKRAALVSWDDEDTMWTNGTFGSGSPRQLVDTLIFHLGLHLALRASQEHRNLLFGSDSQLQFHSSSSGEECLKYIERTSKNKAFGINHSRLEPKVTYIYQSPDQSRCVVNLYKTYIRHR